eukprot:19658-Heterococcus_DN1.PRE.2
MQSIPSRAACVAKHKQIKQVSCEHNVWRAGQCNAWKGNNILLHLSAKTRAPCNLTKTTQTRAAPQNMIPRVLFKATTQAYLRVLEIPISIANTGRTKAQTKEE